jgi:hypothetical protein
LGDSGLLFFFLSSCHILLYQLTAIKDRLILECNSQNGKMRRQLPDPAQKMAFPFDREKVISPPRQGTKGTRKYG